MFHKFQRFLIAKYMKLLLRLNCSMQRIWVMWVYI